jgi:hypothetical protein
VADGGWGLWDPSWPAGEAEADRNNAVEQNAPEINSSMVCGGRRPPMKYARLTKEADANGKLLMAVDADLVPGPIQEWPPFPFALTTKARQRGAGALKEDSVHYTSAQMNQMLLERIYEGQIPDDLIQPAWVGALLVLVLRLIPPSHETESTGQPRGEAKAQGSADGHRQRREFNEWC